MRPLPMADDAVRELQVKVAFLEDSLHKLSDEFYLQQRELEELKANYAALINKVRGMQSADARSDEALDERPPHY